MKVVEFGSATGVGLLDVLLFGRAARKFGASSSARREWVVVSFFRDRRLLRSCVRWRRMIFGVRRDMSFESVWFRLRLFLVCTGCTGSLSRRSLVSGSGSRGGSRCARGCCSRWHRYSAVVATGCGRGPSVGRMGCSPTPCQHYRYACV